VALSVVGAGVGGEAGPGGPSDVRMAAAFEVPSYSQIVLPPPDPEPSKKVEEPPLPELPPPPEEFPEPEDPLGIDDGHDLAKAWKGAAVATENLAPKSKVDQAALAIEPRASEKAVGEEANNAPLGAQPSKPVEAEPAVAPAPVTPPAAEPVEKEQAAPVQPLEKQNQPEQPEAQQKLEEQPEPLQPEAIEPGVPDLAPAEVELPMPQDKPQQLEEQQTQPQQLKEQQTQAVQPLEKQLEQPRPAPLPTSEQPPETESMEPRPPMPPVPATSVAPGMMRPTTSESRPGLKAQEESPAASIEGSMTFKPGEPLAGKGLRVFTVTPKYSITTRMTARPKNAIVLITFGRDGKVLKAVLKQSTGYDDVDKPLVEAVYRWTAKGESLSKIPANDPTAGVTYAIKFLMETY